MVLFELLTGRKPHTGDTPIQVAYAHVHNDVPAPSTLPDRRPRSRRTWTRWWPGPPPGTPTLRPPDAKVFLAQFRRVQAALRQGLPTTLR